MYLLLTPEALYLGTSLLWGDSRPKNAVTLWISTHDKKSSSNGDSLQVRLHQSGTIIATFSHHDSRGNAVTGVGASTFTAARFEGQEDLRAVDAPWWSGEIRLPLRLMRGFRPGRSFRIALRFDGSLPPLAFDEFPEGTDLREQWPAQFVENEPSSWALVTTARKPLDIYNTGRIRESQQELKRSGFCIVSGD
jgi:hypothetical protein